MKKATLLATAAIALVFGACNDSQFDGYTKAENGLHYKFFNHDENATKVQEGDGIVIRYIIMNQKNDSVIVDSKSASRDGSGYTNFGMQKSSFKGSFEDGMMMMAKGDSAEFIIPADSFFLKSMRYNELPKGFSPGQYLKAVFKIKDITPKKELEALQKKQMAEREAMMKDMEGKEKPTIEKYIADNKITVKPTASGIYYIETKKGNGKKPVAGQLVKVGYAGRLLDGTLFDTSDEEVAKAAGVYNEQRPYQPAEFVLGQATVMAGWEEGIMLMSVGSKGKLVVPSALGYGVQGNGPIPPFAPLVFDVELLDIKAAPAQGAPMPGH